ncbi:ribonucleoside diphosphate reductase small subuni t [Vibrio phage K469]
MDHLKNKAFFDGEVEIQRFDVVRHPPIERLNNVMLSHFWRPEEVDVTKDKADYDGLPDHQKHIFTSNLKRQIVLDTKQGREPLQAFLPLASSPETECAVTEWSFQELIHTRSYTHIIRGVLTDPSEIFDNIFDCDEIKDLAEDISKYYDGLIKFNEMKAILDSDEHSEAVKAAVAAEYDEYEHKKAFWRAMFAVNALEGVRFYVSFACSWAFAEVLEKMEGNAKIIKLICRDENNHLKLTQMYLNRYLKEDPDFIKIKEELQGEMTELFMAVVEQEKEWARYLFKDGSMLGLNYEVLASYVDYIAAKRMLAIGLVYPGNVPDKNPLPWTSHWIAGDIKQTALQEAENDSYLLGVLTGNVNDALGRLRVLFPSLSDKTYKVEGVVSIWGRVGCPYCVKAKAKLDQLGINYNYYTLDVDFDLDEFLATVEGGHNTFPAVFHKNEFVGGYDGMLVWLESQ